MSIPSPSATVMLLRDSPKRGIEALLVRRNTKLITGGGAWVFPGGRVDALDYQDANDHFLAAQHAAVRETKEETGVSLCLDDLTAFAHWTTPSESPRRFATWFFLAHAKEAVDITVDGGEIVDYAWYSPQAAFEAQRAGRITIMPPTFVCLTLLAQYGDCLAAVAGFQSREVQYFNPRIVETDQGRIILYDDDAGYARGNPQTPGRRHRILIAGKQWEYQNDL